MGFFEFEVTQAVGQVNSVFGVNPWKSASMRSRESTDIYRRRVDRLGDVRHGLMLTRPIPLGRFRMLLARFVAFILVLSFSWAAWSDDAKPAALEGTWLPSSAELAGKKFPDEVRKSMKLVIKDDDYTVTVGTKVDKGTVKSNPKAKPKSMDITGTDGPNKGKTMLAIYELDGDTLRICYDLGGKGRPTKFETKADTKLFLVTYKREKR